MLTLDQYVEIAGEAADIARGLTGVSRPGRLTAKGSRDYASEVDVSIEKHVRELLSKLTPDIGMIGEETGTTGPGGPLRWIVDPIDGTANFIRGSSLYGFAIALLRGEKTLVGLIDIPRIGTRFSATAGGGAYRNQNRVSVAKTDRLEDAIIAFGDFAVSGDIEAQNAPRLKLMTSFASRVHRVRMLGSAVIDLTGVAEGSIDATVMLSNNPWDTAAAVLVAREAGAVVVDCDMSPHSFSSRSTISATPGLLQELGVVVREALVGMPD